MTYSVSSAVYFSTGAYIAAPKVLKLLGFAAELKVSGLYISPEAKFVTKLVALSDTLKSPARLNTPRILSN